MSFTPPGGGPAGPPPTPPPAPPVPGWWLASDGNWYPPHATPGGAPAPGPYGPPAAAPYGYSPYQQPTTNGLAIASLVCGIVCVYFVTTILAIIFGFVALNQINQRGQNGRGLAIAGITCAFCWIGLVLLIIFVAVLAS
jgi:hypothetical protein